jgi:membrane fusion protein (multidrug efflux system)
MTKKLLLAVTIFALLLTGCNRKQAETTITEEPVIPVTVALAEVGTITETFTTTGTVEANNKAEVASKVAGRVTEVRAQLGDYVEKGQLLVALEKTDYLNQLQKTKTTLIQTEVNYRKTKDDFVRKQKLYEENIISQSEYDTAKNLLEIAEMQLKEVKIGIEMIEEQLRNTEIRAPISGFIGSRNINPGEMANPGAPLFVIVDLSQVYVTVNLSDSYISQAKLGQAAEISLAANPEQTYQGTIKQIAPIANATSKTFPVKILLNNSSRIFKDGMLTQVRLKFNEKKDVIKTTVDAILEEPAGKVVYVVNGDRAERRVITLGISDGKFVEVLNGLQANEQVVTLGQNNLEDGSKVVVK